MKSVRQQLDEPYAYHYQLHRQVPLLANPVFLDLHLPAALPYRVSSNLAHVRWSKLVDLSSTTIFLKEVRMGEVELQRIV
jgi:hypothetical protein